MSGKYALIIGNTEYTDPGLAQLTAPGKDAEDFARVIKDQNICAFDDVKVLLNQLSSSVIEAVDEFFDQRKPDDMLVLYFSGHGIRDEIGSLYLAFQNTIRSRLRSTAIKSDYIKEAMDQSRSKRQVLILDCCNSGAFPQGTKAELGGSMGMTKAFQGYGRFVLTASDATQFAWEGDQVIGETDNSLFTHFLVQGLEGEADSDGDGRITVDELYEYAYDQISRVTPKQTPTKASSKVEGEIVLRQNMRIEDIKPVALPDDLINEVDDPRPAVREWAVQRLEKILKGKNIGMARSAREALEKIAVDENTTRRVEQMATQLLDSIRQAEKAEEERKAREEAERIAVQQAEEERFEAEKAEAERKAKEEAERLAALKAEEERLAAEKAEAERKAKDEAERLLAEQKAEEKRKAKEEEERLAALKVEEERLAAEKAEAERKTREKEKRERLAREKAKRESAEKAAREKAENEAKLKSALDEIDRKAAKRTARERTEREIAEQNTTRVKPKPEKTDRSAPVKAQQKIVTEANINESKPVERPRITSTTLGVVIVALILCGFAILNYLPGIFGGPAATEAPVATEPPATEPPITEAPTEPSVTEAPATEAPVFFPTPAPPFPDIPVELMFGPQDGNLPHVADDNFVESAAAYISVRDFIVVATFQNPYSDSTGTWDYGFFFRDEYSNNAYRLVITSTSQWILRNHVEGTDSTIIQEGELPNLDTADAGFNTIWLYCSGDYGEFYVNGEYISDLDLSARQNFGDVKVGTGFSSGNKISGYSTDYFEFTVWEIR